jgi:hypothetical protein
MSVLKTTSLTSVPDVVELMSVSMPAMRAARRELARLVCEYMVREQTGKVLLQ